MALAAKEQIFSDAWCICVVGSRNGNLDYEGEYREKALQTSVCGAFYNEIGSLLEKHFICFRYLWIRGLPQQIFSLKMKTY